MEDHSSRLRAMLEQLEEEIQRTEFIDDEGREILGRLEKDVQGLLARSGEVPGGQGDSLAERLRQGIQHFEVTHPTLTSLMEQVVNTLSGMGF
jgi:Domain of unknown function (DUF4404)